MRKGYLIALLAIVAVSGPWSSQAEGTPISSDQVLMLYFTDSGRSFGYQVMIARIQIDTVKADLARDEAVLRQNEELYARNAIPLIELQISQLKDAWNRKQLIVAEKNLVYLSAEYEAMSMMARHFAGEAVSVEDLYAIFRRGWDAGCDKGPDEVIAYQAWAAYAEKSLERARQLNERGSLPDSEVLERESQLAIAQSNHQNRRAGLERCRKVLFPSLEDVLALPRLQP
jgi:hypothetical protein